jgi:3-oxoacyl-[acyl-carrier-protein] synthase-1
MVDVLSTNITSPLGFTTEQNYQAVRSGRSALKRHERLWGLPEPFAASLFSEGQRTELAISGYTFFESLAIRSACEALSRIQLDTASARVVLILSTTKGDIGSYPSDAAKAIAKALGVTTTPIVVCNACVSGLSAQLLADRLLSAGFYDHAIVVGAEVQSKFIVAGFQSLKAVSEEPCRPFDIERNGLNPGEAAATIVFARTSDTESWCLTDGATCNDAYHISSPSPQGDGCLRAIEAVMEGRDKSLLATVCVHGTATLYNDQMESKAIERAGLSDIPLSALKGYYGHTMGAAGVLETILTMRATDDGIVLPSKGFTELGVSGKVSISGMPQKTDKCAFLKIMSGFGGCNVAALYTKTTGKRNETTGKRILTKTQTIKISSEDGKTLTDIYKEKIANYPKFYKMDILSRLAFVAAERTLSNSPLKDPSRPPLKGEEFSLPLREGWGGSFILFNHSSSIVSDRQFLATISDAANFFPSPSVFVYTLPNIAAGEVAIRHHLTGETSFYILPEKDEALMQQILEASLCGTNATTAISGWVDAESKTNYECELSTYNIVNIKE